MLSRNDILSRFKGVQKAGQDKYKCMCPAHIDKNPSLSIAFTADRCLFHCHANCTFESILENAGLSISDVMPDSEKKSYTWRERMEYGLQKNIGSGHIVDVYDYCSEDGKYLYSKVRFQPDKGDKKIRYYQIDRKNDVYSAGIGNHQKTLYKIASLIRAVRNGNLIFFVEGEKDVKTLSDLGFYATTCGGANDWKPEFAKYFTGAKLVILPDNDKPGEQLANLIRAACNNYAYWIQVIRLSEADHGDVTDWVSTEGGSADKLLDLVNNGRKYDQRIYAPWLNVAKKCGFEDAEGNITENPPTNKEYREVVISEKITVNTDLLANYYGRGNDFLICRNQLDDKDDFYAYQNGSYSRINKNAVLGTIKKYFPSGTASARCIDEGYRFIMSDSPEHVCKYEDLDRHEMIINVQNGIYNVEEKILLEHSPKYKSTIQLNCQYKKKQDGQQFANYPLFDKYITDFCSDINGNFDQQKHDVLQEFAGLIVSNIDVSRTKKLLFLYSPLGDSGKSVFLGIIDGLIGGERISNVALQDMHEGNKFALGGLIGKRLISCGDEKGDDIEDSSILKQLTGGDRIKVEQKGKQPLYMRFKGGILIAGNVLPHITGDRGEHLFNRFLIIPCTNHFSIGKNADPELKQKIISRELDGVFMWALEGLHRLIDNHFVFSKCDAAEAELTNYRIKSDSIFRFVDESGYKITKNDNDRLPSSQLYDEYIRFCEDENIKNHVSKMNFKTRMISIGCRFAERTRINGSAPTNVFKGIQKRTEELCSENTTETTTNYTTGFTTCGLEDVPFDSEEDDIQFT